MTATTITDEPIVVRGNAAGSKVIVTVSTLRDRIKHRARRSHDRGERCQRNGCGGDREPLIWSESYETARAHVGYGRSRTIEPPYYHGRLRGK